jgi:tetratricopeptide (TPR) repeat protein
MGHDGSFADATGGGVTLPGWAPRLTIGLLLVVHLALLGFHPIVSEDTPWHLKQGELYVTTMSLPDQDPFAFTTAGREWIKFSWAADIVLYLVFQTGGFPGLVFFRLLMLFAIVAVLYRILRDCGLHPLASTLVVFAASLAVRFRLLVRPEILSFVLILVLVAILLRLRAGPRWLPYLMLPVQAAWANVHASFVFGVAIPGLVLLANLARGDRIVPGWGRLELDRARVKHLAAAVACLPLATLLNPHGLSLLLFPVRQNRMVRLTAFGEWVEIWRLPDFGAPWWTPVVIFGLFVVVFVVTAVLLVAREGRVDPVGVGIVLFMGTYAAFRSRAIPYFVLAAAPLLALALVRLAADAQARFDGGWPRRWERLGALACLLVLATSIGATVASGVPFRLGFGPVPNSYPEGAAAFLERHRLDGRLFNTYQFGGYLLWRRWPANRVFIDGRYDAVLFDEALFEAYRGAHQSPAALDRLTGDYGVDILVLDARPTHRLAFLDAHGGWARVYWDPVAEILVRRNARHADLIARHEYRLTGPRADTSYLASYRRDPETRGRALDELRRAAQENPQNTMAWLGLAQEYQVAGPAALAERVEALSHAVPLLAGKPMEGRARAELAETFLQMGRHADAVAAARAALRADTTLLLPYWVLAAAAERGGSLGDARDQLQALLQRISADHPMAPAVRERLQAVEEKLKLRHGK